MGTAPNKYMNILSIDTSSSVLSVALKKGGETAEVNFKKGLHHAENLIPLSDKLFRKLKLLPQKVDLIACGIGPGSFTGLRIGISAAKGLAIGLNTKVAAMSSLDLIASHAHIQNGILAVLLDARRERFYTAIYEFQNGIPKKKLLKDSLLTFDELRKYLVPVTHATGDGVRLFSDQIQAAVKHEIVFLSEKFWYPRAASAFDILKRQKKIKTVALNALKPAYMRLTEAEERRKGTY